jgi:hypothetical protein
MSPPPNRSCHEKQSNSPIGSTFRKIDPTSQKKLLAEDNAVAPFSVFPPLRIMAVLAGGEVCKTYALALNLKLH